MGSAIAAFGLMHGVAVANTAEVRVLHASPDAPGVDIVVNGQKAISDLKFPSAIGPLDVTLEEGTISTSTRTGFWSPRR